MQLTVSWASFVRGCKKDKRIVFVLKMTWQVSIQSCRNLLVTFCLCFERLLVFLFLYEQVIILLASAGRLTHQPLTQTKGTKHVAIHEMGNQSAGDGGFRIHPVIQASGALSS